MTDPIFTPAELADIHAYFAPKYFWLAISDVVYLAVALFGLKVLVVRFYVWAQLAAAKTASALGRLRSFPVARALWKAMDKLWSGPGWGTALYFVAIDYLYFTLVYLPVDVYLEYVHEHRYLLGTDTLSSYALDSLKGHAVSLLAWSFLAVGLFGLARKTRAWWWALSIAAVLGLSVSAALDPYRAQLYFKQEPLPAGPLRDGLTAMLHRANVEIGNILVVATSRTTVRVQAYFSGEGPTRTVTLTDTFVNGFSPEEVMAAVGHEAGHIREPRWLRWAGVGIGLTAFLWFTQWLLRWVAQRGLFGATERADVRALPLLVLCFNVAMMAVTPLSNAFSRQQELAADVYAMRLTGNPTAFKQMLVKAARINKSNPDPPRWVVLKGATHPPLRERLEQIAKFERARKP